MGSTTHFYSNTIKQQGCINYSTTAIPKVHFFFYRGSAVNSFTPDKNRGRFNFPIDGQQCFISIAYLIS